VSEQVNSRDLPGIGPVLREFRLARGQTQEELAERAGLGVRSIQGFELGERRPRAETVQRLVEALALADSDRARFETVARLPPPRRAPVFPVDRSKDVPIERGPGRAMPHNLPTMLTSFVGRAREVAEVKQRLASCRLVTLTGPPGVGKTRLALEAASELIEDFDGGVRLVPLAAIRNAELVLSAIALTVDVGESDVQRRAAAVSARLRNGRWLLILDNFEQVVVAAPLVAQLLEACPRLSVLVTSRTRLRVRGEREVVVPPLTLPTPSDLAASPGNARVLPDRSEAVQLFVERARDADSDFLVDSENLAAIAEICRQVEGLPLSIELAAAWCKVLAPPIILKRLTSRLALLTTGAADLPLRQQTLRDAIAWSYELLSAAEQTLLRRLAVFVGGFTLAAAEVVGETTVETVTALVEKSLLNLDRRGPTERDAEPRFGLLETIRDYALERLTESGEVELLRGRHATYFLAFAESAQQWFHGPQQTVYLDRLDRDHDNLRVALRFFLDREDAEHALRLSGPMQWLWALRCYGDEPRTWLAELGALARSAGRSEDQAQVLRTAGRLAFAHSDYPAARARFEEALVLARHLGDNRGVAESLAYLGLVVRSTGDYSLSRSLSQESLEIYRELGDEWAVGAQLDRVGMAAFYQGDLAAAHSLLEESLQVRQRVGEPNFLAWSLLLIGQVAHHEGDYLTARSRYVESLDLWRRHNYRKGMGICTALASIGDLAIDEGDLASARDRLRECLQLSYADGYWEEVAYSLEGLGGLAALRDAPECALRLAGAAAALRATTGDVCPPDLAVRLARRLGRARTLAGEAVAAAAWARGQAMTLEQAIAEALAEEPG
jgi:predicted ATPase/DNA-binding XRE family transcriptional regulator